MWSFRVCASVVVLAPSTESPTADFLQDRGDNLLTLTGNGDAHMIDALLVAHLMACARRFECALT
ncbi:MAG: hypothetical protein QGI93_13455 [Planctomycetota bacterium]|nr:hypothetical protein [Planctomycetota bacterium]